MCIILLWLFNYCILELQCNSECSPSEVRPLSSIIWLWGNYGLLRLKFQPYNKPKNLTIAPEEEIPIIWEEVIFLHFDVSIPGCVISYKLRWFNLQGNNVAMTKLIVGMVLMLGLQHAKQERPKRCTSVSSGLKMTPKMDDIMEKWHLFARRRWWFCCNRIHPRTPKCSDRRKLHQLTFRPEIHKAVEKKKHKLRVNFYPDYKVALPKKGWFG